MPTPDDHLAAVLAALQRVRDAESALELERDRFRETLQAAIAGGVTRVKIAEALGVSRQRVQQMLARR